MNIEDEYDLPRKKPFQKWLWFLLTLALVAGGSYAYATNLGGVRDALATVRETATVAVTETTKATVPTVDVDAATLPDDPLVYDLSRRIADLELRSAVRDAVERHPELATAMVRVQVADGRVTLSGTVDTAEQRDAVEQIAAREGAESVESEIALRAAADGPQNASEQLARKVEFELYSTDAFDLSRIEITGADGEIRLGGSVRSLAERLLAERIAGDTAGVETVVNDLEVAGSET